MSPQSDYLRASAMACNSTAVRQAARHLSRFYDKCMAEIGLRATQYIVLLLLARRGPATINDLAEALVMDRSSLGHNLRPLERNRLVVIEPAPTDRRRRIVTLTEAGTARVDDGRAAWLKAQTGFEGLFGADKAARMRETMAEVVSMTLA